MLYEALNDLRSLKPFIVTNKYLDTYMQFNFGLKLFLILKKYTGLQEEIVLKIQKRETRRGKSNVTTFFFRVIKTTFLGYLCSTLDLRENKT